MPSYSVGIKQSAQKELDALNDETFARIDRKILALAENPRPNGCKKLKGFADHWRIRIGDYRVIYSIDDPRKDGDHHARCPPARGLRIGGP